MSGVFRVKTHDELCCLTWRQLALALLEAEASGDPDAWETVAAHTKWREARRKDSRARHARAKRRAAKQIGRMGK